MTSKQDRVKRQMTPVPRNTYEREPVTIDFSDTESLTEQHHAKACDINSILARYKQTGVIEHIAKWEPQFGDVSDLDFKRSMDTVAAVKSEFEELPAFARAHYDGDPTNYLHAVSTPEGLEELRNLKAPGNQYQDDGSPDTGEPAQPQSAPKEPEMAQNEAPPT